MFSRLLQRLHNFSHHLKRQRKRRDIQQRKWDEKVATESEANVKADRDEVHLYDRPKAQSTHNN